MVKDRKATGLEYSVRIKSSQADLGSERLHSTSSFPIVGLYNTILLNSEERDNWKELYKAFICTKHFLIEYTGGV